MRLFVLLLLRCNHRKAERKDAWSLKVNVTVELHQADGFFDETKYRTSLARDLFSGSTARSTNI